MILLLPKADILYFISDFVAEIEILSKCQRGKLESLNAKSSSFTVWNPVVASSMYLFIHPSLRPSSQSSLFLGKDVLCHERTCAFNHLIFLYHFHLENITFHPSIHLPTNPSTRFSQGSVHLGLSVCPPASFPTFLATPLIHNFTMYFPLGL